MKFFNQLPELGSALSLFGEATTTPSTSLFNITALTAANNASRLECWQLTAAPVLGGGGVNYALGDAFTQARLGIIPPNTTTGTLSNAPRIQYTIFLSGLAYVRTPDSGLPNHLNEVYITGGRYGMLLAADVKQVAHKGHVTTFPGLQRTLIAQFPVAGNKVPEHTLVHEGPCTDADLADL
ncbi:small secreted protein [Pyrenophora tritici-repentis]|uniref:Small secreted protein n=2 Tax=Pyrenophora tritici-repentis TaxID=45151 RepID=A0A2W1E3I5_9PLEO|nr:uncharacterized protein PTRG_02028 [Pyrenophora tritici-repentis Pt-1C-BFP]KAA8626734.1 small secreted protein [Pyrenophora tritici-repentis]EDU41466.1 conserved hypothetical protein [Pyrenophora tritici-repentis Pt-1C-BFP]KAF7455170.1 small secreted protein [Pyrenophora tritici-repentis]KAF7578331.1 hypothetical protein PtrM4_025710 [Pyrenophora tritici-repentis]KAG9388924.1 small secreted protein [Pyrenophora tritici-repentis]